MFLALKIASEAISAQHLKDTEEHEETQSLAETLLIDFDVELEIGEIDIDEFLAQLMAIVCRGLP